MARNLQKNLPSTDTLLIQDINVDAMNKFVSEAQAGASIKIAASVREAAENSVSPTIYSSEFVFLSTLM